MVGLLACTEKMRVRILLGPREDSLGRCTHIAQCRENPPRQVFRNGSGPDGKALGSDPRKTVFDSQVPDVHKDYFMNRYHTKKARWIELLGGECVECGSIEELEFDHIDPTTKLFTITSGWALAEERVLEELQKCQLLCKEHHKLKSDLEQAVEHGSGLSGKRNCKCDPCKVRKNEYMRAWKRSRKLAPFV